MDDRDLQQLLGEAFSGRARELVPDNLALPPMAIPSHLSKRRSWLAPLASAAAVVAAVGIGVGLADSGGPAHRSTGPSVGSLSADAGAAPTDLVLAPPVGSTTGPAGVGAPVTVRFSAGLTDARAVQARTTVTVHGKPLQAEWYFVKASGGAIVGYLRPATYWPAHASITVAVKAKGLTAGRGLRIADDAAITFATAAADVVTVDAQRHELTVVRDGHTIGSYPVSMGSTITPTPRGVLVITARGVSVCQTGPGFSECGVKFTQRLTQSGVYLLAAPWNGANIGKRNTTNGSIDLRPADAETLYKLLRIGDVVTCPNATGRAATARDNGWWNVPWAQWRTGGVIPTH